MAESAQKVTFYMGGGSHFSTHLSSTDAAQAKDAAAACWKGEGCPALSVGSTDGSPPALINLTRVDLIRTEEVAGAGRFADFVRYNA